MNRLVDGVGGQEKLINPNYVSGLKSHRNNNRVLYK